MLLVIAVLGLTMAIAGAGTAMASGGPGGGGGGTGGGGTGGGGGGARLRTTGTCGDILDLRLKKAGGPITVDITVPSADAAEMWTLTATEQEYNAVTGGRVGSPVNLVPTPLPPLAFSIAEGGFSTTADFTNTVGLTHGWSYTATRTFPTPITCTNSGFWTAPAGSQGPVAANPVSRPDTAPVLTGASEADRGTHTVLLQFDQEMLSSAQGLPALNRFTVTVNGTARTVTAVSISNDSPPSKAVLDLTFSGAVFGAKAVVAVTYHAPLSSSDPQLQDLESLTTAGFGPVTVPIV